MNLQDTKIICSAVEIILWKVVWQGHKSLNTDQYGVSSVSNSTEAYDLNKKYTLNMISAKKYTDYMFNLNISFIIYLIILKKQILYSYDRYSYNLKNTFITCFIYIK